MYLGLWLGKWSLAQIAPPEKDEDIRKLGRDICEVKELLEHGQFELSYCDAINFTVCAKLRAFIY